MYFIYFIEIFIYLLLALWDTGLSSSFVCKDDAKRQEWQQTDPLHDRKDAYIVLGVGGVIVAMVTSFVESSRTCYERSYRLQFSDHLQIWPEGALKQRRVSFHVWAESLLSW